MLNNNADFVNGNTYTWKINNGNVNNVEITFEVSKNKSNITHYIIVVFAVILVGCIYIFIKIKNKKNNKI